MIKRRTYALVSLLLFMIVYVQTDSLESALMALEVERRSYQESFEGGPDGYLVTDPRA